MVAAETALAIAICWLLPAILFFKCQRKVTTYELHAYQHDFLLAMAAAKLPAEVSTGVTGAAAALEMIVAQAIQDEAVRSAIYDGFHCVHCGSKDPAAWIKERKGKKEPYTLPVTPKVAAFLATDCAINEIRTR
jgi:hypothetical protein